MSHGESQPSLDSISTSILTILTVGKKGIIGCLNSKQKSYDNPDIYQKEMVDIKRTPQNNKYSANIATASAAGNIKAKEDDQKIATVCLPYIRGLSEKYLFLNYYVL